MIVIEWEDQVPVVIQIRYLNIHIVVLPIPRPFIIMHAEYLFTIILNNSVFEYVRMYWVCS